MQNIIKKILDKSVNAPSGDNSQPWQFKIAADKIFVYVKPNIDLAFYNYDQKASLFANGCVIENIVISASYFGLKTDVQLFPDKNDFNLTAVVNLIKAANIKKDPLFDFIDKRVTNRKFYKKIPLGADIKDKLINEAGKVPYEAKLVFVEDRSKIKELSKALTINERIVLETEQIHKTFFKHVVWTKKEENKRKTGLFVKTLEMKPPEEFVFKLCKNWRIMNFLNKFGMSRFIANENAKRFNSSSALAAILVKNNNKEDFVYAGRVMQRIWLKAVSLDLSLHPITGVIFLIQSVWGNKADVFKRHIQELKQAYRIISDIFGVKNEFIPFIFRIGYADQPSAKSSKKKPEIING